MDVSTTLSIDKEGDKFHSIEKMLTLLSVLSPIVGRKYILVRRIDENDHSHVALVTVRGKCNLQYLQ